MHANTQMYRDAHTRGNDEGLRAEKASDYPECLQARRTKPVQEVGVPKHSTPFTQAAQTNMTASFVQASSIIDRTPDSIK